MSLASRKLIQATAGAAGAADTGDDEFANVVLLLDGDGTSGDANNTFTDSSTNGFPVTETGSVVQGSFSPYGDNWSNYFDGSGNDKLEITETGSEFEFGTGDFTVECFFYETGQTGSFTILGSTVGVNIYFGYGSVGSGGMSMYAGSAGTDIYSGTSSTPESGQWNHLVWQRSSGNAQMYLNGTRVYNAAYTANFSGTITGFRIGKSDSYANYYADGYISNFHITKGSAVYSGDSFTVPSAPLSNVASTSLLTCQSNRFVDENNNRTITLAGTPKVTPFSPFKDDDARDITTDGGSAYFNDSTSTYLSLTNITTPRTDSFTIEFWAYFLDIGASGLFQFTSNLASPATTHRPGIHVASGGDLKVYGYGGNTDTGVDIVPNQWYHIALSRSGSTLKTFVNGVITNNATDSEDFNYNDLLIGKLYTSQDMNGYISDFRYVKGTAVYTSAFTPPTTPLTAITNTETLLSFQDAGIYDRTGLNNLDTVGNAQIDTAVTKYGTGSIEFNGSTDYLLGAENQANTLAISDAFTAECWFYQTATAGTGTGLHSLISHWNNATGNKAFVMGISSTSMVLYVSNDGSTNNISGVTGGTVSNNVWNHAALTWDGTNYRVFLNGTAVITQANSSAPFASNEVIQIGTSKAGSGGALVMFYQGYMDDVRITNGVARYTSSFTPPTAALPKF